MNSTSGTERAKLSYGSRATRQRALIIEHLSRTPGFRSAQRIHQELTEAGATVSLATVYRNVQAMAEAGILDTVTAEDGEQLYRHCKGEMHHHHLVCRECGHTVELEAPEFEEWSTRMGSAHGFTDTHHRMELFGLCSRCSQCTKR